MKYTARGESRVKLSAIFVTRPSPRAVSFIQSVSALSVLLYFTPINLQIKHSSLIVLNKGIVQINSFL